ncbi:MAG: hypothetical protein E6G92_04180 [Alphaproteobacteria bacterium]|nr:MAG: hypothetical protein E6G92_04180 [Alphaproteobacteria bacterium]
MNVTICAIILVVALVMMWAKPRLQPTTYDKIGRFLVGAAAVNFLSALWSLVATCLDIAGGRP